MADKKYIAVDLGAESGRVMIGTVSGQKIKIDEMHRFLHGPIDEGGSLHWDFPKMLAEIKIGIRKAVHAGGEISGIGIDSWGVDYGLLGDDGKLIGNPYHYRDNRTDDIMDKAFEKMPRREVYEKTGLQFMQLNTVFQLYAMRLSEPDELKKAKKLLMMADLVGYHLCGRLYGEYTLASTSQLMNMRTGEWAGDVFEALDLPVDIMPEVVPAGTVVGELTDDVASEVGAKIPVIACGSHDTTCAVAAVPAGDKNWAYLSSGTWSVVGVEIPEAVINDKSYEHQFTNEGGVQNTIRFLVNITGLWIVQECRRHWQKEGDDLSYAELTEMAAAAKPFAAYIDPGKDAFLAPGEMPRRINEYLEANGQEAIDDKGQMVRVVLEGLALKYRDTIDKIEDSSGSTVEVLHIVGGGTQNELLSQFAANAIGKRVVTGPVEATAIGNVMMQAIAAGQIGSLSDGRAMVRNSCVVKEFQPKEADAWNERYEGTRK